jgi:hypothetical protein
MELNNLDQKEDIISKITKHPNNDDINDFM